MNQYMVEVALPAFMSQQFIELIPKQRAFINQKLEDGVITGYSLAMDRSKLWVTFIAKNRAEVEGILRQFPIYRYVEYSISELAFHESANMVIPSISLN